MMTSSTMTSYILLFSASLVGPLAGLSAPLLRLHTVGSGRGGSAADADAARDAIANYWHAVDNSDVNNATTILILRTDPAIRLSESDQAELLSLLEQLRSSPLLIVDNGDAAVEAEGFLASLQIPYKRGFLPPSFYALAVNHHSALAAVLSDINSEDRLLVPQLFASAGSAYRKKAPPAPPKEESTKEEADDEDSDEDGAVVEESEEDDDEEEDEVPKAKAPANKRPVMGDSHEDEDEDEEETPKKTIPSKAASQKKPSEDSNEEDDDSAEVIKRPKNRLPCKYRKSCYESGRLPEVLNPVVEKKDVDDDEDDDEEEGGEKARTDDSKLGCKYRKSCYETGKLPKVLNPVMEPTESDEESSEEAIDANPYASGKLRCKYRKSCYSEEGIEDKSAPSEVEDSDGTEKGHKKHHHHQTQQAHGKGVKKPRTIKDIAARALKKAEEEEARAKSEYRPSTASKASEKMAEIGEKLAAKLDCKYRKSCYESGNLPEIDSYSFALPTVPYLSSYISGDKDGDGEPDEEEEEPVDFAEMKESQQKFHCRYRKSCYETGERPAAAVYEPMAFVDYFTLPESSESRIVVSKELGCKYRKSCYESGEVPVIESTLPDLAAFIPSFFSGGSGSAHPQEKVVQIEADAESVRNFCKYRKSCYESIATAEESGDRLSEIVEERKEEKRRARKKGHSKANDDPREKEVKKTRKEKEAVKVEVKKQEAPKKKEEKKPEPVKETKKTFKPVAAKVVEDVVEEVMVKKIVKQAEPKKKAAPPPPPPAKVEESEESKEEDEEEEEEKAEKITPKKTAWKPVAKVVPKIEEPEVSEEDVEEPAKKQPASKLHYKKTGKTAVPPPKEDEIVEDEDENMPTSVQGQRDFCKYRKSCYDSGKKPVIESSHSSIFAAIIETAEREYAAQETASKNVHLSAGSDPRLACKYRKSCYENGELPEQLHPVHHIHPEAASSKEVHISAGSNPKLACKYRTSCYETGELPAQLHPVVVDHDDDDEEEDDEEERSAVDGSKLACKYRKSCYETGKLPKVLHPTLAASPVDDDEDDDSREIEDDSGPRRLAEKKKLRCKYRSSCYKSGKLPKVLNPVVVVDHDEDDEVEQRHLSKADSKLKCKYRKSCYGDEEDDDKEEEEEKKEKKASKTHAKPAAPVPKVHVKFEHKKRAERAHHKTHVPAPESNEVEGDEDEEEEVKKEEIKPTKEEPVEKPAVKIQPKVEVEEKDEKSDEVEDDKDVSTEEEEEKEEVKVVPVPIKKPHAQKKIVEEESAKKVDAPKAVEIHAHELGNKSHFTAGQKLDCKYRTSCYAGIPEKKVEETAKAPEAAGQRVPTTPVERPGRCHKYLLSCREFLGLPPKEKVPTGPHGRKLCRRKKDE